MNEKSVLEASDVERTLRRIAHEVVEKNPDLADVALVGIHTRGVVIANRLHEILHELTGGEVDLGEIDISFYRDDIGARAPGAQPVVHAIHVGLGRYPAQTGGDGC